MRVKRRAFQLLRVPYDWNLDEGVQVLRCAQATNTVQGWPKLRNLAQHFD
jgi:hypothetical protein